MLKINHKNNNPIIVFAANLKVLKNKVNRIEKLRSDGCCN